MKLPKKLATTVVTAGLIVGGVALAIPASAATTTVNCAQTQQAGATTQRTGGTTTTHNWRSGTRTISRSGIAVNFSSAFSGNPGSATINATTNGTSVRITSTGCGLLAI